MFTGAYVKFSIGSLDDSSKEVDAQYNPKELQFDRSVTWGEQGAVADQRGAKPGQEYAGAPAETVKIELLFDGYENNGDLHPNLTAMGTVESNIRTLRELSSPTIPVNPKTPEHKRPHYCVAWWGTGANMIPRFECVIESLSVKYSAFGSDGAVLRATVTVGLRAADRLKDPELRAADAATRAKRAEVRRQMRATADDERTANESATRQERQNRGAPAKTWDERGRDSGK